MIIENSLMYKNNAVKISGLSPDKTAFKDVLASKKSSRVNEPVLLESGEKNLLPSLNSVVEKVITNHELATKSVRASLVRTNYTPEQLLGLQYKTGMLFMAEQMFCKTAELSANTLKNFTQMQI